MDTEKYFKLKKQMDQGLSPNDEGPYYHHAWWESYKGSVKGKFGGLAVGGLVGAIMGTLVAAAVTVVAGAMGTPVLTLAGAGAVVAAFTSAGAIFGVHEFSEIGKITGAVSAAQDESEVRMKLYEESRFNEIKHDIDELRALVKGDQKAAEEIARKATKDEAVKTQEVKATESYRTTHYAQLKPDAKNRFAYWTIVAIGLVVGAAAGALLAYTGAAEALLHGISDTHGALGSVGIYAASMATFGALGASFGLNRDLFRKIFDKTDLWFKGIFFSSKIKEEQIQEGLRITNGHSKTTETTEKPVEEPKTQEKYDGIRYPESDTYYQDKVLAAAEKALLSFDHTRATPH